MWKKVWNVIEHHRFTVIAPITAVIIWSIAVGCIARIESPLSGRMVGARELQFDFEQAIRMFEFAGEQLKEKQEAIDGFRAFMISLVSGDVADFGAFLTALLSGGFLGILADNIRKNGVIGGLKRSGKVDK